MILSGLLTGSRSYGRETLIIAKRQFENETELVGNPSEEEIYFDDDRSWLYEMEDFRDCVVNQKPVIQGSIQDAINAMNIVEQIYKSDPVWHAKTKLKV